MQHTIINRSACRRQPAGLSGEPDASRGAYPVQNQAPFNHPYKAIQTIVPKTQHSARGIPSAALTLLSVVLATLIGPSVALASWPLESEPDVLVGFEDVYGSASGKSAVHHGVDCEATAGETVTSPAEGTVSFTGSVPAGETAGCGTTLAVSIALDDGLTLTLMPFDDVMVEVGERIEEGRAVGHLAASGDKSSGRTHLHVGLKRGRAYFDPLPLLGMPGLAGDEAGPEPDGVLVPVAEGDGAEMAPSYAAGADGLYSPASDEVQAVEPIVPEESVAPVGAGALEPAPSGAESAFGKAGVEQAGSFGKGARRTIASGSDAYDLWLATKEASDVEKDVQTGPFERVGEFLSSLHGRVAALIGDIAPALGSAAPAIAAALLAALCAGTVILLLKLLRSVGAFSKGLSAHRRVGRSSAFMLAGDGNQEP